MQPCGKKEDWHTRTLTDTHTATLSHTDTLTNMIIRVSLIRFMEKEISVFFWAVTMVTSCVSGTGCGFLIHGTIHTHIKNNRPLQGEMDLCSSPVLLLLSTSCLLSLSVIRDSAEHKELRRNLEPLKNPGKSSDSSAGSGVAALEEGKRTNRTVDFGHHGDTSSSNGGEGGVKGAAEGGASMWRRAEGAELRLGRKRRR